MNKIIKFFNGYTESLGVSAITQKNTLKIIRALHRYDPWNKTKFEVSFKVRNHTIAEIARFLSMDVGVYSCRSQLSFLARLEIYRNIIEGKLVNPRLPCLIQALAETSKTPMDLYFGADIENNRFLFAFWLIYGGIKRSGKVSFCPFNFNEIIEKVLGKIEFEPPLKSLKNTVINLGFDIDNKDIFYKFYYLLRKDSEYPASFDGLIKRIDKTFVGFSYFSFFSQMYNDKGRCCREKLFIEFLEDISPDSTKNIGLLAKACEMNNNYFELERLERVVKLINGRISLISFEDGGELTFYIRADKHG